MSVSRAHYFLKVLITAAFSCCFWSSYAQQYLDEGCYLATSSPHNIPAKLEAGYRVIFLGDTKISDGDIDVFTKFLNADTDPLILIFDRVDPGRFNKLSAFVYTGPDDDPVFGPKFNTDKRLYIFSYDGNFLNANNYLKAYGGDIDKRTNNLTIFRDNASSLQELRDQLQDMYRTSGNLPNILISDRPATTMPVIDSLNQRPYFNAIVLENGVKLEQVSWDTTALKSDGKIHTRVNRVRPYKRGYMFSPDVINFNQTNASTVKIFRAHRRRLSDGLSLQLDFDENLFNKVDPSSVYRFANIEFVKDDERSWVGEFSGREQYIDFGDVLGSDLSEVTIAAWVKPHELSYNRSIVGVGESFSAKILDGNLVFTTPDIRDHVNKSHAIAMNEWSHVSFVYDADGFIHFYVGGKLMNSMPASTINSTSQSLIIGTNLWDEFFLGKMDDLKIWKRALSDEEIELVYNEDINPPAESVSAYRIILIISLIAVLLAGVWKFRNNISLKPGKSVKIPPLKTSDQTIYNLRLFGSFQLKNRNGAALTNQFSPQRKELFLLILMYTIRKDGIDSNQMTRILWEGCSPESAKNNRSTQMVRLREILSKNTGISLTYTDKLWKIQFESSTSCDLVAYQTFKRELDNGLLSEDRLSTLLGILGNGVLLPKLEYEWLDRFKGEITNEILEMLTPCFESPKYLKHKKLMQRLTDTVIALDPLNEQALSYRLTSFLEDGKHALARHTFESYQKAYFNFYNEPFSKNFTDYTAKAHQS
ncbi:hypothetical protein QQ020_15470 [Fulvivirgaceae bacterium BMA12]|uniref:LamG-like jellyroll fold domain-containing protein n=1 Tax=Agaribacillus aureus TaxID=3051825 RepID=A0ABT8L6U6_9BACT|nr:hypothetical protein [Fulvivirgaceae bacterium BMA12]